MYAGKGILRDRKLLIPSGIIPDPLEKGSMGAGCKSNLYGPRSLFLMEVDRVVSKNWWSKV